MESTGDDTVKAVEITGKVLKYYINLVNKVAAGLKQIDSNFERSPIVDKMLSNSMARCKEIICAADFTIILF